MSEELIELLLEYQDDYENYPFRELVKQYNKLYNGEEVKLRKVYGEDLPKNGKEYLQEIVNISKNIPSEGINRMDSDEFKKDKFGTNLRSKPSKMFIINPSKSYYYQFASRCPFYEGSKNLLYFTYPKQERVGTISLQRHIELIKVLKLLKKKKKKKSKTKRSVVNKDMNKIKCGICFDAPPFDFVAIPCGHTYCFKCIKTIENCAFCGIKIRKKTKTL